MFHIFDVLSVDATDTIALPYEQRRELLAGLVEPGSNWLVPAHRIGDGAALLAATAERGLEGVMAKRLGSTYTPGKRTKEWRKIKNRIRAEVVIGGYSGGSPATRGHVRRTARRPPRRRRPLQFAGGVGTGFNQATLEMLRRQLRALRTDECPFDPPPPREYVRDATWVRPELRAEIELTEFTNIGLVRQSSFLRLVELTAGRRRRVRHTAVMAQYRNRYGPHNPDETYVAHAFPEQLVDLGEVQMNYATVGDATKPALLLVPGQTESWWGYEEALRAARRALPGLRRRPARPGPLDAHARSLHARQHGQRPGPLHRRRRRPAGDRQRAVVGRRALGVAVRLRQAGPGAGRPLRGPAAVRLAGRAGDRPGHPPGHRRDVPDCGAPTSATSGASATGTASSASREFLPPWLAGAFTPPAEPPQNLKEYDPEWGRAFWTGTVAASCDHERMLRAVKVPVLLTHHFRSVDADSGLLMGALSDVQAARVRACSPRPACRVDYRSFETMGHSMHGQDPQLFADTLVDWAGAVLAAS